MNAQILYGCDISQLRLLSVCVCVCTRARAHMIVTEPDCKVLKLEFKHLNEMLVFREPRLQVRGSIRLYVFKLYGNKEINVSTKLFFAFNKDQIQPFEHFFYFLFAINLSRVLFHTHTHTHTPVSYTHLDVYKRQTVCCSVISRSIIWRCLCLVLNYNNDFEPFL